MIQRNRWLFRVALFIGLTFTPTIAQGQTPISNDEDLDFDRPEAWAMKYFTSVSLFTGLGIPGRIEPGSIELGLEAGWVPRLDEDQRRVGFIGTKAEDLNKTPMFGRVRVTVGLPRDLSLTLGYVPPVEINGAEPNLFALALGRPLFDGDAYRVGARLYGQVGSIDGDFTCDNVTVAGGTDIDLNPFLCEEISNDEATLRYAGLEVGAAFPLSGVIEPRIGVAVNYLDMEFQVNARYSGLVDTSLLTADGFTFSTTAGLDLSVSDRITLSGDLFYSPLSVDRSPTQMGESESDGLFNLRGMVRYRIR